MLWKTFAGISVIVLVDGCVRYHPKDWIDVAAIPVEQIAVAGLVIYAFDIARVRSRYWAGFAWFYAAFAILGVYVGAMRSVAQDISVPIIIAASFTAAAY